MNLWLIGMMGVGKTTVGRAVAERVGARFADSDDEVVAQVGCSIADYFGTHGEQAFRDMEQMAIERLAGLDGQVVATGGGAVLRKANVDVMRRSGTVVWLDATAEVLTERIGTNGSRPLLSVAEPTSTTLQALSEERNALYLDAAHIVVPAAESVDEVIERVERLWDASK
ncbi:MAG: shikimate kinase [Acidimicrobiia bacterium]|nr:shikimate kinase [Acidimicrobiia bacterium]